jgi:hypothetical protein
VLRKIETRGAHELRERVQQRASMIFRYAIATGSAPFALANLRAHRGQALSCPRQAVGTCKCVERR